MWGESYWKDSPCDKIGMSGTATVIIGGLNEMTSSSDDYDTDEFNEQCTLVAPQTNQDVTMKYITGNFWFKYDLGWPTYNVTGIWN